MGKYKVCVYAIAKNEEKNVEAWVASMNEADEIYVMLDATSSDRTEELLTNAGVNIKRKLIKPWRFDVARNESLKMVPEDADICVCTDLDEVFSKGWRKILEEKWQIGTNQATYKYWHNAGLKNEVPNIFNYSKIHDRHNFTWKWIIHEYIVPKKEGFSPNFVNLDGVMLYHYPDIIKPRSYKNLLESAIEIEPDDMRYQLLLLEEYVRNEELDSIDWLINKILNNKELKNLENFGFAYKSIVQMDIANKDYQKARQDCYYAISIVPDCRWFYGQLGDLLINQFADYELGIAMLRKCLSIEKELITARETEWKDKARINNLISIAYYHLNDYVEAISYINKSIEQVINLNDKSVYLKNLEIYENKLSSEIKRITDLII